MHSRRIAPPAAGRTGRTHRAAGFSLIELMVVLTIAGVILSMAVPNFVRLTSRDRVEAAAYEVHRNLILARQKALARRTPYRVRVLDGGAALRVERKDPDGWVADPAADIVLSSLITLQTSFGGHSDNTDMVIEPQGTILAEDAPALFHFTNDRADTAWVRAVRTGRIRTRTN